MIFFHVEVFAVTSKERLLLKVANVFLVTSAEKDFPK